MTFSKPKKWADLFSIDPATQPRAALLEAVTRRLRAICNDLNQRSNRREISSDLEQLIQIGKLLADHDWLRMD